MISEDYPNTTTRRTLFDISKDLETLADLLDEWDEGDDQQQKLLADWFDSLGEERDRKLDGYASYLTELQARSNARRSEAERLSKLVSADESRIKLLKERLKTFFTAQDITTIHTKRYKLSLAKNGGALPLHLDTQIEYSTVPESFKRITFELNKEEIRKALENGEQLRFARLGDRGTSLRIK